MLFYVFVYNKETLFNKLLFVDPLLIIGFIVLFMLSAFFSGTELALMSLPDHKIDSLIKNKKFGSKALGKIKKNNDRLLITILIGNNLVNTFTAAFATSIAIGIAKSGGLGISEASAIGIATWIVTFLLLLFGEIIPKSIATKNAAKVALSVAPIYKTMMFVLYPIIIFMEGLIKVFSGKWKVEKITNEEIESFIDMWKHAGSLEDHEHEKIKNILDFDETMVEEIMTPRVKVEALENDSTVQEALDFYLKHTHSRIPVYSDTIDKIDSFITTRDLLKEVSLGNTNKKLSEIQLHNVLKVPLNQSIKTLFENFQKAHKILAIVIDEYGGVAGIITMEDIIEEVFWEIRDETDKEAEEFVEIGKNSLRVESDVLVEDILEKFELDLEHIGLDEKEFGGETLSFLITHVLESFPEKEQIIEFKIQHDDEDKEDNEILSLKVLDIENAKIGNVDVRRIKK